MRGRSRVEKKVSNFGRDRNCTPTRVKERRCVIELPKTKRRSCWKGEKFRAVVVTDVHSELLRAIALPKWIPHWLGSISRSRPGSEFLGIWPIYILSIRIERGTLACRQRHMPFTRRSAPWLPIRRRKTQLEAVTTTPQRPKYTIYWVPQFDLAVLLTSYAFSKELFLRGRITDLRQKRA